MDGQRDRDRTRRGDRPSRFSDAARDRSSDKDKSEGRRLFISNIPYEYRWTELKDLFKEKVGDVAYVELFSDDSGKSRGCGVVEFTTSDAVKKALNVMHRHELNGRKMVLKEEPSGDRSRQNPNRSGGRGGREDKEKSFDSWGAHNDLSDLPTERCNTYGLSLQFLDSLNVQPPLVKKVFVANLDYKADRNKIKEIFKMAGKVRNIDLAVDKDGKSRGFAVIEYDHPVEAVQAISMFDKHSLFDRRMTVRMDRASSEKPTELKLPEGLNSIGLGLGPNGDPLRDVARNLPQAQTPTSTLGLSVASRGLGAGMLGSVPSAASVALNGLGGGMGGTGLGASNSLGGSLGFQAMGLSSLGALQSQLLQQGLTASDLAGNLASALQAQGLSMNAANLGLGNQDLGGGMGNSGLSNSVLGNNTLNSGSLSASMGNNSSGVYGRSVNSGVSNRQMSGMSAGTQYGRESMSSNRDKSSDMVVISNLPHTVTWQIIREKFSECGDVKFAEMTASDTAIVRFHKEWDAERAIKMFDRTRIDGKTIDVRFF